MKNFFYGIAATLVTAGWLIIVLAPKPDAGFALIMAAWIVAIVGYHKENP
jgi:hypothetical protein